MNDSYRIGSLLGIEIRVHVLFLYMMGMVVFYAGISPELNGAATAVSLVLLFTLVILHELGHSLVARHFGIRVLDIVLWPLGGMARMSEIPENPRIEGLVAVAGPLVNLALAAGGWLVFALLGGSGLLADPLASQPGSLPSLLAMFVMVNLALGLFNLVPAFPMDGGRILRAWLGRRRTWLEATEMAVRVSRVMAWGMILSPLFLRPYVCALPLIGLFVLWAGARELWATRMRHAAAFGSGGGGTGPCGPGGPGAFTLHELLRAMAERQARGGRPFPPPTPPHPGDGSPGGARPPVVDVDVDVDVVDVDLEGEIGRSGGFTEEDVRRLERFPGRLRRPPAEGD